MEIKYMELLPVEIIHHISDFLEIKDLPAFSQTSKYYNNILIGYIDKRRKDDWKSKGLNELIKLGDLTGIKYLVEECNIDFSIDNNYAMKLAGGEGYIDIVKYFQSLGVDIRKYSDPIVCWASRDGHLEMVKYIFSLDVGIITRKNYALISAIYNGHLEIVKYLHSVGADITANDNSSICLASEYGYLDIVKYLHSLGADINAQNNFPIKLAKQNEYLDIVEYIRSQKIVNKRDKSNSFGNVRESFINLRRNINDLTMKSKYLSYLLENGIFKL